jgi:hypothetical protein
MYPALYNLEVLSYRYIKKPQIPQRGKKKKKYTAIHYRRGDRMARTGYGTRITQQNITEHDSDIGDDDTTYF